MRLKPILRNVTELTISLAAIATLTLAGCGGGGGGGGAAAGANGGSATTSAAITPFKGPFLQGATVTLRDANGNVVNLVSGGTVNASGVANVTYNTSVAYPLTVEVSGSYFNEISGKNENTTAPLRSLIANVNSASTVPVTIVTETAVASLESKLGSFASTHAPINAISAVAALSVAGTQFGIPASAVPVFDPVTLKSGDADTIRLAALAKVANDGQAGTTLTDKVKAMANAMATLNPASSPSSLISQTTLQNALTAMTTGASSVLATGKAAPTPPVINTTSSGTLNTNAEKSAAAFSASQIASAGAPDTVTVVGLSRLNLKGALALFNNMGDTLSIQADGTYTFATPLTAAARLHTISAQPAGGACQFTKNRIDVFDPYTAKLVTQNTSEVFCYESPCGNLLSLGKAPAPKGLTVTTNPDSTVSFSWQNDPWATGYRIYYGTSPNVVANDPTTGFSVFQNEVMAVNTNMTVPPNTNYYYAITSTYRSPSNLDSCQSSASPAVTATQPVPAITGMSPGTGTAGGTVTITGTNFSATPANNTVMFNGVLATVTAATTTSLTVTVPGGATTGPVTVKTVGGIATGASFTVSTPVVTTPQSGLPTITGVSPITGSKDTIVTITGSGFSTNLSDQVYVNGVYATVTAATATSITATIVGAPYKDPLTATNLTGPVTVTTAAGTASGGSFTVTPLALQGPITIASSPSNYSLANSSYSASISSYNRPSTNAQGAAVKVSGIVWDSTQFSTSPSESISIGYEIATVGGDENMSISVFTPLSTANLFSAPTFSIWGQCSVKGPNAGGLRLCSSLNISINRTTGTVVFSGTPVSDGKGAAGTLSGSLSFPPF